MGKGIRETSWRAGPSFRGTKEQRGGISCFLQIPAGRDRNRRRNDFCQYWISQSTRGKRVSECVSSLRLGRKAKRVGWSSWDRCGGLMCADVREWQLSRVLRWFSRLQAWLQPNWAVRRAKIPSAFPCKWSCTSTQICPKLYMMREVHPPTHIQNQQRLGRLLWIC